MLSFQNKILSNEIALKFLGFGFSFDNSYFLSFVEELEQTVLKQKAIEKEVKVVASDKEYIDNMRNALVASTKKAIEDSGATNVRIGITGGMDSRLLYAACREILPLENIFTFTIGYDGQYDYEFAKKYGFRFLENHFFADTSLVNWDIGEEVNHKIKQKTPSAYSPKRHIYKMLVDMGAPIYNVHGFMGDPLVGGTKPDSHIGISSWEDAVKRFKKKNDRFRLQDMLKLDSELIETLPENPKKSLYGLDDYDLLDFGLRQNQRILGETKNANKTIIPYTDNRWMLALLSHPDLERREKLYFEFLKTWAPDVFPELVEEDIVSREQHKKFRAKICRDAQAKIERSNYLSVNNGRYTPQLTSKSGGPLTGRQFCDRAEYDNSASFKHMVDTAFYGLRVRNIFPEKMLDDIWESYRAKEMRGSEQVRGLVSFEINLRAGKFGAGF